MNAVEIKANPGAVRAWARKNGIAVSKTGTIARHVWECYVEANPATAESVEMQARNSRPDLFALADDMVEAEMIRAGRLSFDAPQVSQPGTPEPMAEEPRSLSDWLRLRDELAAAIAEHSDPREAAEALLVRGWMMGAAA